MNNFLNTLASVFREDPRVLQLKQHSRKELLAISEDIKNCNELLKNSTAYKLSKAINSNGQKHA